MHRTTTILASVTLAVASGTAGALAASDSTDPATHQQARLLAYKVLPAQTYRAGSPPSGAFLTAANRATASANGVPGPAAGAYFDSQPVQGFSSMVPAGGGTWWALADNGYGTRNTSADWQLAIYRLDPHLGDAADPEVLSTIVLRDPRRHVPWKTACDPLTGADLPPLSFNVLPNSPPEACGTVPGRTRVLTGFDFDPESLQVGRDGTFWIGDEFGPFLLHADARGRLLEPPVGVPGAKSPQNPTLDVVGGERPTVAQSRGFESLAISPDRRTLYPMLEGALSKDDPQDVRILRFDVVTRQFAKQARHLRLEMPGGKVDLSSLQLVDGSPAYPGTVPPAGTGGESAAELTAVNATQMLVVERDSAGDDLLAPRQKKIYLLDLGVSGRWVSKTVLIDLMAAPDPAKIGGDGDFFRFPFNTIESVHVVDPTSILVANDNNYPFSNGRARSRSLDRTGLGADDNELIVVGLGSPLDVDPRLVSPPTVAVSGG